MLIFPGCIMMLLCFLQMWHVMWICRCGQRYMFSCLQSQGPLPLARNLHPKLVGEKELTGMPMEVTAVTIVLAHLRLALFPWLL